MRSLLIALALCTLSVNALSQGDVIRFARYPHSSGNTLVFSYQGDIWVSSLDGSNPRRLTAHVANDRNPRLSPDGSQVAFTSDRMGNDDIFVVATGGDEPRQVTFHSTGDTMLYWTPDGERLVFATSRGAAPWSSPLYTVSTAGDLPVAMSMDRGAHGMISQDGTKIAFNRNSSRYWRKGYRGNSNTDVWVQDLETEEVKQLTDLDLQGFREHTQDAFPMWGTDGVIYFLSEKGDTFNIWRIAPDGGTPSQVTHHTNDGVQFPSMSPDGKVLTYENDFRLWKLEIPEGQPEEIVVQLGFDPKANLVEYLRSDSEADGFSPSPDGSYLAVDYHGEIFVIPSDAKVGEKKQVTQSAWRDRNQVWSPDGEKLAYISDESGDEEFWIWDVATGDKQKISTHPSLKRRPIWSPDSKKIAHVAANNLILIDVASGQSVELAFNDDGGFSLDGFSPDGKWLVYSRSDANLNSEVYLFEIGTRRELNVTDNPFRDSNGIVSSDGKSLLFLSTRDGGNSHLFRVSLQPLTEDPEDPVVRERHKSDESEGENAGAEIVVNRTGIGRRAIQMTTGASVRNPILSGDGTTIYFTSTGDGGAGLFSIGVDGQGRKKIADGGFQGLTLTNDGKTFFYRQGGGIYKMPVKSNKGEKLAFSATVRVDKRQEWRQIFEESWRTMKYRFYDSNMHGVDWDKARETYLPLLAYVGQNEDVYDLANEMIGELNASHTGVRGPNSVQSPATYQTRLLGFEMEPEGDRLKVTYVYRGGPADKEWLDISPGDYVVSIDGQTVGSTDNYWNILNHSLNDYVTVSVTDRPGSAPRDQRIKTITSLRNIKYEEWVEKNREYVQTISAGNVAYVHIRSMNQASLRVFENDIDRFWNAKSIVVDIRYNGGGNIDQQLLDILERRPYEYWNSRWGGRARGRRPRQAIAGPKVMLINWRSASDSEVTPLGFRDLGLGRIVGNPTNGSVIATGSYSLINGATIRTPGSLVVSYDPSKPNNYGINLENYGVAPDVWAENSPTDESAGFDRELKAAVDEALKMLSTGTWQYRNRK